MRDAEQRGISGGIREGFHCWWIWRCLCRARWCVVLRVSALLLLTNALGHPFDLTKTRLQTAAPGTYTGAIDVVKKTIAKDGVTGYALPVRQLERKDAC